MFFNHSSTIAFTATISKKYCSFSNTATNTITIDDLATIAYSPTFSRLLPTSCVKQSSRYLFYRYIYHFRYFPVFNSIKLFLGKIVEQKSSKTGWFLWHNKWWKMLMLKSVENLKVFRRFGLSPSSAKCQLFIACEYSHFSSLQAATDIQGIYAMRDSCYRNGVLSLIFHIITFTFTSLGNISYFVDRL